MFKKIANIKDGKIDRSRKSYSSNGKMILSQFDPEDDGLDMRGQPSKYNDYPDFDGLRQQVESWQMDDPAGPDLFNELKRSVVMLEDAFTSSGDIEGMRSQIKQVETILNHLKNEIGMHEKSQWVAQGYTPGELEPEPSSGQGDPFGDQ